MSGFDDLGRALRDDADRHAPRASAFDVDALTRAARARRAPRLWGTGALALAAVLGIGGLALTLPGLTPPMLLAGGADEAATLESADGGGDVESDRDLLSSPATAPPTCGEVVAAGEQAFSPSGIALGLVDVQLERLDDTSAVVTGSLVFENSGELAQRVEGQGSPDVALVNADGVVVATTPVRGSLGLAVDLPSGGASRVPFAATVVWCAADESAIDDSTVAQVESIATVEIVSETTSVEGVTEESVPLVTTVISPPAAVEPG